MKLPLLNFKCLIGVKAPQQSSGTEPRLKESCWVSALKIGRRQKGQAL